jgi:hypothetical protein
MEWELDHCDPQGKWNEYAEIVLLVRTTAMPCPELSNHLPLHGTKAYFRKEQLEMKSGHEYSLPHTIHASIAGKTNATHTPQINKACRLAVSACDIRRLEPVRLPT